jgi:hypothetical protein
LEVTGAFLRERSFVRQRGVRMRARGRRRESERVAAQWREAPARASTTAAVSATRSKRTIWPSRTVHFMSSPLSHERVGTRRHPVEPGTPDLGVRKTVRVACFECNRV